jgi:hypothetical protein
VAGLLRNKVLLIIVPAVLAVVGVTLGWPRWTVLLAGGAAIKLLIDLLLQVRPSRCARRKISFGSKERRKVGRATRGPQ